MITKTSAGPLLLIAVAIAGAAVSYHFTLQTRLTAIEQKLDQTATALQQYQASEDALLAGKTDSLTKLSKEVDTLQASLGKASQDQSSALDQIRQRIASLGQLQQAQQDAQQKLADYAGQLDKIKHVVETREAQVSAPPAVPPSVPLPTAPAPAAPSVAPVAPTVAPASHASTSTLPRAKPVVVPLTENSAVDLRPADIIVPRENAVRALPVALPVTTTLSDNH
jgi:TolA-binding protein